jgi:hypothetical protein
MANKQIWKTNHIIMQWGFGYNIHYFIPHALLLETLFNSWQCKLTNKGKHYFIILEANAYQSLGFWFSWWQQHICTLDMLPWVLTSCGVQEMTLR